MTFIDGAAKQTSYTAGAGETKGAFGNQKVGAPKASPGITGKGGSVPEAIEPKSHTRAEKKTSSLTKEEVLALSVAIDKLQKLLKSNSTDLMRLIAELIGESYQANRFLAQGQAKLAETSLIGQAAKQKEAAIKQRVQAIVGLVVGIAVTGITVVGAALSFKSSLKLKAPNLGGIAGKAGSAGSKAAENAGKAAEAAGKSVAKGTEAASEAAAKVAETAAKTVKDAAKLTAEQGRQVAYKAGLDAVSKFTSTGGEAGQSFIKADIDTLGAEGTELSAKAGLHNATKDEAVTSNQQLLTILQHLMASIKELLEAEVEAKGAITRKG